MMMICWWAGGGCEMGGVPACTHDPFTPLFAKSLSTVKGFIIIIRDKRHYCNYKAMTIRVYGGQERRDVILMSGKEEQMMVDDG